MVFDTIQNIGRNRMRKLKLIMSDTNFTNAVVHDENGEEIGYISEIAIRPKRSMMFIRVEDNISSTDMATLRDVIKESLHDGSPDPFVICTNHLNVGKITLDDYQVDNAKIIAKHDGEWLSEEDVTIKDIIE